VDGEVDLWSSLVVAGRRWSSLVVARRRASGPVSCQEARTRSMFKAYFPRRAGSVLAGRTTPTAFAVCPTILAMALTTPTAAVEPRPNVDGNPGLSVSGRWNVCRWNVCRQLRRGEGRMVLQRPATAGWAWSALEVGRAGSGALSSRFFPLGHARAAPAHRAAVTAPLHEDLGRLLRSPAAVPPARPMWRSADTDEDHDGPAGFVAAGVRDERRDQNRHTGQCQPEEWAGRGGIAPRVTA
jgi:hypothetical protein